MTESMKTAEEIVPQNIRDEVFKELRGINKNNMCIDCEKKNPKWASIHLGIHLCIDCAGKHRQYGVMYSFIKSTNLDAWNRKQLTFMQKGGNSRALQYFRRCGVISDTLKHIDYKSPIVQKYKSILVSEVEVQITGVNPVMTQKIEKKKIQTADLSEEFQQIKKPKQIPSGQVVQKQEKGKKKNKKKMGKKINLEDFDTMEFDDGVPAEEKQKIIRTYQNNAKFAEEKVKESVGDENKQGFESQSRQNQPQQITPPSRQLTQEESKQKLEQIKAKANLKSISSEEFKDNSLGEAKIQQNLNKFQSSSSISSSAFFGEKDTTQDTSIGKLKDFVADTGEVLYNKLSGLSGYWKKS